MGATGSVTDADPHAGHATEAAAQAPRPRDRAQPAPRPNLPPAEEGAKARLNASPRHGEYADIALGGRHEGPGLGVVSRSARTRPRS